MWKQLMVCGKKHEHIGGFYHEKYGKKSSGKSSSMGVDREMEILEEPTVQNNGFHV